MNMRTYRDKFVAHLDDDPKAKYPQLDIAIPSTKFLYTYMREREVGGDFFHGPTAQKNRPPRAALTTASFGGTKSPAGDSSRSHDP